MADRYRPQERTAARASDLRWILQTGVYRALKQAIGVTLLALAAANITWTLLVSRIAPAVAAVVYIVVGVSVLRSEDYLASVVVGAIGFVLHMIELVRRDAGTDGIDGAFLLVNTLLPFAVLCLGVTAWRSAAKRRTNQGDG